jgi:hypothetical protein
MSESEKQNIINYLSNYWIIDVNETLKKYEHINKYGNFKCSAIDEDIKYNILKKADLQADNGDAEESKRSKCVDGICFMKSSLGKKIENPNYKLPFTFRENKDDNVYFSEDCKKKKEYL